MTNVVVRVVRATKFAGVLVLALAAAACANRPYDPQAGGSAPPGSQQDFVVNVGDRVFFESDSSELTSQSKATPTSGARASTTSRSAPAARRRYATISRRAGSIRNACARFPTARNARSRCATTFHAGRRTVAR